MSGRKNRDWSPSRGSSGRPETNKLGAQNFADSYGQALAPQFKVNRVVDVNAVCTLPKALDGMRCAAKHFTTGVPGNQFSDQVIMTVAGISTPSLNETAISKFLVYFAWRNRTSTTQEH